MTKPETSHRPEGYEEAPTLIARAACGCVRGASVLLPDWSKESAKFAADMVKRGYALSTLASAEVRTMPWTCDEHKKNPPVIEGRIVE